MTDLCPWHTYGRNTVDLACFGVPHVVSNRIYSGQKLWDKLSCDPYDIRTARHLVKSCLDEKEWVQEVVDRAYEDVEWFNHKNSVERYNTALDMVEEGKELNGWCWSDKQKTFINPKNVGWSK